MIGIFTANTDGFKAKFTLSFAIKFFQYWYLKEFKKNHIGFNWMKMSDIPTHSLVGYDVGSTGEKIIFESSKTQQLYPYYKSEYEFKFDVVDKELFWELVKKSIGNWYAFFQLYYFIKMAFWMTLFPRWFVNVWADVFHGGKHIFRWGNAFVSFQICTEQAYNLMQMYANKYNLGATHKELGTVNANNVMPLKLLDMCLNLRREGEFNNK